MKEYFIARSTEDGTTIQGPFTKEEVLSRIIPDKTGGIYYGDDLRFLDKIPDSDKGCWDAPGNPIVIIKSTIVLPKYNVVDF